MSNFVPSPQDFRDSFQAVNAKKTFLDRECELLRQAHLLEIDPEKYRSLFEIFIKNQIDEEIMTFPETNLHDLRGSLSAWRHWLGKEKLRLVRDAFDTLLQRGALITFLILSGQYLWSIPQRMKESTIKDYQAQMQAWQVINSFEGKITNSSLIAPLQILNEQKLLLNQINIRGAYLEGVKLQNSMIQNSNLQCINFYNANLEFANLAFSNLHGSNLYDANLNNSRLFSTNLSYAYLNDAKLNHAELENAVFRGADLTSAVFEGAELCGETSGSEPIKNFCCADFRGFKAGTLKPAQIKKAKDWEGAQYDPEFRVKLGLPKQDYQDRSKCPKNQPEAELQCPR